MNIDSFLNDIFEKDIKPYTVLEKESATPKPTNPFLSESHVKVRLNEGGGSPFFYEQDSKVSIYPEVIRAILPLLNAYGLILFMHLITKVRWNQDWLRLDQATFAAETGRTSKDFFYKAIDNLMEAGVLADRKKGTYWLNPWIIFRGNRIKYAQENKIINLTK